MKNLKQLNNSVILLTFTIFLQSFSLLSIKYSTLNSGLTSIALLLLAFLFMVMRAILWQYTLRLTELSRVYPFASLVQVLILIYAVVLFKEVITMNNVIGFLIMLTGIFFISRDKDRN